MLCFSFSLTYSSTQISSNYYTVEKILDMSYVDNEKWFKVKWEGYGM